MVFGVNHGGPTGDDVIASNACCTSNCPAPVARVLHEGTGISRGFMTTVHSSIATQPALDTARKTLYRSRAAALNAAALNMVPTTTGPVRAIGLVLSEPGGRPGGMSVRAPTSTVSMINLTFDAARNTFAKEVTAMMRRAAASPPKGVPDICDRDLVSMDFRHEPRGAIYDADQTRMTQSRIVRVLARYDNEWGLSNRMADTAAAMGQMP